MAKTKAAAKDYPLAHLLDKEITPTMDRFAEWLKDQTGYDVDVMSVQLAGSQRGLFQKSEFNQSALAEAAERREAAEQAREERRLAREAKAAEKESKASAKPAAKTAKPAAKPAAKAAAAKPTTTRRRPAGKKEDF